MLGMLWALSQTKYSNRSGQVNFLVIMQCATVDEKNHELVRLDAVAKAALVQSRLRASEADALIAMISDPLAVMVLQQLGQVAIEGVHGLRDKRTDGHVSLGGRICLGGTVLFRSRRSDRGGILLVWLHGGLPAFALTGRDCR